MFASIENPGFPSTYFPYDQENDAVAPMYFSTKKDAEDVSPLVEAIKQELKLAHLDSAYNDDRCYLVIKSVDLPRLYEIIQALVSRGHSISLDDGTRVTFAAGYKPSQRLHQKLFLKSLWSLHPETLRKFHSIPHWYRSSFWSLPEGKAFAKEFRQKYNLKDE